MNLFSAWQHDLARTGWTTILSTVIDIFLVAAAIYWLILLSKRTRAWQIIWGLIIFLVLVWATEQLQLHTLNYLLKQFIPLGPVAIVILFFPELRHALENMGRVAGWGRGLAVMPQEEISSLINAVAKSVSKMAKKQIGALIVIEREHALEDIVSTGTKLGAEVSEELIGAIFYPGNPLHDGAVIIRGTRIIAAGCTLPLSESAHVGTMIHTRHKAALGVVEQSDAAVVVVSEETGTVSVALEGKLHRNLDEESLARWLRKIAGVEELHKHKSDLAKKVNGTIRKARSKLK